MSDPIYRAATGEYVIPSGDYANLWPMAPGYGWEFQIPVKTTSTLTNSNLTGQIHVVDAAGSPWLYPTKGIYVFPAAPVISSLSPSSKQVGSAAFNLVVNGSNFTAGDKVYWNGAARTTTVNSSVKLTASISAVDVSMVKVNSVTVVRSGYPPSNAKNLSVHTFADVLPSHTLWRYVEGFYARGITGGCGSNPLRYCPSNVVTRQQMAIFLLKS